MVGGHGEIDTPSRLLGSIQRATNQAIMIVCGWWARIIGFGMQVRLAAQRRRLVMHSFGQRCRAPD
jgi:hypothetical protein